VQRFLIYRMQFQNVIGQQETKKHLVNLVQQNRLSHALLFLGKEGNGSLSLALAFAQYIVCTSAKHKKTLPGLFEDDSPLLVNEQLEIDSCGTCPSCLKAQQYVHPDIHFSFPVIPKKSGTPPVSNDYMNEWREFITSFPDGNVYDWLQFLGAENKQGNITAEECNQINHKLSLKAFESDYKILIMWMPEFLGAAGNRLLKLIEEPPPDTIFIFVAEDENAILPTILSRTQLIKIPLLEKKDIEEALLNKAGAAPERAEQVAALSEGNYREALHLLEHSEEDWHSLVREWLNVTLKNNTASQLKWIDEISQLGREKQKQFIRYFIHLLEQAVRLRYISLSAQVTNLQMPGKEKDFAARFNNLCSIEAHEEIIKELDKAVFYIERNAHAKMLFHALTIRLYYIIKDNSLILVN
jgi:DNA polymerase III subunit delta'